MSIFSKVWSIALTYKNHKSIMVQINKLIYVPDMVGRFYLKP